MASKEHEPWIEAMGKGMHYFLQHQSYEPVPPLLGCHLMGNKWVFKVKTKADGSLDKLKTRLVTLGYTTQEGIDFTEVLLLKIAPQKESFSENSWGNFDFPRRDLHRYSRTPLGSKIWCCHHPLAAVPNTSKSTIITSRTTSNVASLTSGIERVRC